jgi:hypothetical protein
LARSTVRSSSTRRSITAGAAIADHQGTIAAAATGSASRTAGSARPSTADDERTIAATAAGSAVDSGRSGATGATVAED